jgi:Uma2 family endonuclease
MASVTRPESTRISADDFARIPDPGYPVELVEGRIMRMTPPRPYHGYICMQIGSILREFVRRSGLGFVVGNDSGIITRRDPDTVRGADVAFYRAERIPGSVLPRERYLDVPPDLVVEVLSPSDRWPEILTKVAEYLSAGVALVAVVDPEHRSVHVYSSQAPARIVSNADELTFPEVLPGLSVLVKELFE